MSEATIIQATLLLAALVIATAAALETIARMEAEKQRDIARDALVEAMRENARLKGTTWLEEKR